MFPSLRKSHAKAKLDELIHRTGRSLGRHRDPFWRLVNAIRASSTLLAPANTPSRHHWHTIEQIVDACSLIAAQSDRWPREPESWNSSATSHWQLFRSLLDHLFAIYRVPAFMTWAWLDDRGQGWERELHLHLAQGLSARRFAPPFSWRMSKASARWFMQAPDDLRPFAAFRWAQVRSLGGDNRLARCLLQTVLMSPTTDEQFWEAVIQFLIESGPLVDEEVESIVTFIHRQRFESAEVVWGRGAGVRPLQPDLSLDGCSISALRRHIANWQAELACRMPTRVCQNHGVSWKPTAIEPFQMIDGVSTWTVRELLSANDLRIEGGILRHCVGSYVAACRQRRTSIWSMRVEHDEVQKRVLTIEVLPATRTIRQAKGKSNSTPSHAAMRVLTLWAKRAGLKFDDDCVGIEVLRDGGG